MIQVICPVCGAALEPQGAAWRCAQGHCFDVARQGYVNLLTVTQKHSRHPGDTREMVAARRAFLDAGWYAPIAKTLADLVRRFCPETASVLDAGCGEGYYLSQLGWVPERWGIDISRDAVRYAAARDRGAHWLTATAAHLPFADGGFDCVLSMFALTAGAEFFRVLRPGGIFLIVNEVDGENPRDSRWLSVIDGMKIFNRSQFVTFLTEAGFSKVIVKRDAKRHWLCVLAIRDDAGHLGNK